MSARKKNTSYQDNAAVYRAWGLAVGDDAFYAKSLGSAYLFLTRAILSRPGKKQFIHEALIMNFHVGLRCEGEYEVKISHSKQIQKFEIDLYKDGKPFKNCFIGRVLDKMHPSGHLSVALCSPAVVAEAFDKARGPIREYMETGYPDCSTPVGDNERVKRFEIEVMKRMSSLSKLAKKGVRLKLFHTAADLPLTAIYLRFTRPIIPQMPRQNGAKRTRQRPKQRIRELLAIGLYEPRDATAVVQTGRDIELPVQFLVAQTSKDDQETVQQIEKLTEVYRTTESVQKSGFDEPLIFISHSGEDDDLAAQLKNRIERRATENGVKCKCVLGISKEMSGRGKSFYDNFHDFVQAADYAIILYPRKNMKKHNIPYELGAFTQRFMSRGCTCASRSSRWLLIGHTNGLDRYLSDMKGIPHIPRSPRVPPPANETDVLFDRLASEIPFLSP